MGKHGIIIGTVVLTLAYFVGLFVLHNGGSDSSMAKYVADNSLNNLGDFLAGVFSPLAFLWLTATVLIQSKELSLQRLEMEENRKVMKEQADAAKSQADFVNAQTNAMEKQTALLVSQVGIAKQSAERTHRIAMFEKRIDIYTSLIRIGKEDYYTTEEVEASIADELYDMADRSEFMFDAEFSNWLSEVAERTYRLTEALENYKQWASIIVRNAAPDLVAEREQVLQRLDAMIPDMREYVSSQLMSSVIIAKMGKFLDLKEVETQ